MIFRRISLLLLILCIFLNAKAQNLYEVLFMQEKYDKIIQTAQQKENQHAMEVADFIWYATALRKTGQTEKSILVLQKGLITFKDDKELIKLIAKFYFEAGRFIKAKPLLENITEHTESCIMLAKIHEFNTNYADANTIFKHLYQKDTANILYLKHLGNNYFRLDSIEQAAFFYHKALQINPLDQLVCFRLSRIYYKLQEYEQAVGVCDTILKLDSTNVKFLKQTAYVYFKWKKYHTAKEVFRKVANLHDSSVFVIKHLGISELFTNNFHTGREHLIQAYNMDSLDFEICFYLGRAYLNSMNQEKGLWFLHKADSLLQPKPEVIAAIFQEKASIYSALKQHNEALQCYLQAYKLIQDPEYLFYIASIYQNQKDDKAKALKYYELFISSLPPKPYSEHEILDSKITVSLRKVAETNITKLKEELFFETEPKKK